MAKVYVASSWWNKYYPEVVNQLKAHGFEVYDFRNPPKGKGKQIFSYNGKEYHTIQECADDYGISKQGMHKRLKKLDINNHTH